MFKRIAFFLGCSALFAAPAIASNFNGPRFELRGGWDKTTLGASFDDGVDQFSGRGHKSGFNIGAELGYDALLGNVIVGGVYAGIEGATTKDCTELVGNDEACLKLGRNLTLGARLGAKVAPRAMIYVKGGYSNGQLRETYKNSDDPDLDFSDHQNRGGYHFGIGAEFAIYGSGYVRAEYVRTNYNAYRYLDPDFDLKIDGHRDQLLLGFGLRFQ